MSDTGDTISRFKMVNGELVEMTDEEYAAELAQREADAALPTPPIPGTEQQDQTNVSS